MLAVLTQTAHVLTLKFELCEEDFLQAHADRLAEMIRANGDRLTTGFVGTPYLLHMLTAYGHTDLAYTLLFQTKLPSWLYAVEHGATTMWEHWDGIRDDGSLWDVSMNSYNHYAYGAVGDWLYGTVAGIETDEKNPGFTHIRFCPKPTERLSFAKASLKTKYGVIRSEWQRENGKTTYTFVVPRGLTATAELDGEVLELAAGKHIFTK
jgi:alpha-L-rhamnosidase